MLRNTNGEREALAIVPVVERRETVPARVGGGERERDLAGHHDFDRLDGQVCTDGQRPRRELDVETDTRMDRWT